MAHKLNKLIIGGKNMDPVWVVLISILVLVVGLGLGYFFRVKQHEGSLQKAKEEADNIVKDAKAEAAQAKKESISEMKYVI